MNAQNEVLEVQAAARLVPFQDKCVMADLIQSSSMWYCVAGRVLPDVSED